MYALKITPPNFSNIFSSEKQKILRTLGLASPSPPAAMRLNHHSHLFFFPLTILPTSRSKYSTRCRNDSNRGFLTTRL